MSWKSGKPLSVLIISLSVVCVYVVSSMLGKDVDDIPLTGQAATATPLLPGTREVPWLAGESTFGAVGVTPQAGFTPPPFSYLYTSNQAIAAALGILGRSSYLSVRVKRTTSHQAKYFANSAQPAGFAMPTATLPSVEGDYSPVAWVVVLRLEEPYSQYQAAAALQLPIEIPTAGPSASMSDTDTYGNVVCIVLDELGSAYSIRLLDGRLAGQPVPELIQPLEAFDTLGEVGPSFTPTPE